MAIRVRKRREKKKVNRVRAKYKIWAPKRYVSFHIKKKRIKFDYAG